MDKGIKMIKLESSVKDLDKDYAIGHINTLCKFIISMYTMNPPLINWKDASRICIKNTLQLLYPKNSLESFEEASKTFANSIKSGDYLQMDTLSEKFLVCLVSFMLYEVEWENKLLNPYGGGDLNELLVIVASIEGVFKDILSD